MSETVMRRMAKPMLFIAAFIWGSSFFIMKGAVDSIPVFFLLAIRFTGGAALLALICWKKWKKVEKKHHLRNIRNGFSQPERMMLMHRAQR